jgi:mono/diheme cytochrome c family protein
LATAAALACSPPGRSNAPAGEVAPASAERIARGEAVLRASGGCSCHTDVEGGGARLAGGRPLETPFGVYYSSNITPDRETGIGAWSDADFLRAMREGRAPDGSAYFPTFPYPSFTGMSDADLLDLKAYLFSLPPERKENRAPGALPPFSWRVSARAWQLLFFTPARFEPDPARSARWNRGAYLASAVAHCGECHTPRNLAGALDRSRWLAGSEDGPEGELAPNLTPDRETGVGDWTATDLVWFLQTAILPDGDDAGGLMQEVIEEGYTHVPAADLEAIAEYLGSLPPVENRELAERAHEHEHEHATER